MASSSERSYQFGDFHLDPAERLLRRRGEVVPLTPKAFDLLVYLVEHHGRLVEKSSLMAALWADAVVEEANLAFQISALRKALGDGGDREDLIQTVPTKGYRFVGVVTERVPATPPPRVQWRPRPIGFLILVAAIGAPLLLIGVRFLGRLKETALLSPRVVQLTTQTGIEFDPAFSPDGTQVVYSWMRAGCPSHSCGPQSEQAGLWQTVVGSTEVRQLTKAPGLDVNARFSPDGRQIAFVRREDELGKRRIMLVSAVGGPAAKLSDFPAADAAIAWSADGKAIIAGRDPVDDPRGDRGLYAVPLAGQPRVITRATPPTVHVDPALSPDGHRLAFVACRSAVLIRFDCDLTVADITPDLRTTSAPRRLVTMPMISGPVWNLDGKSLIFAGDPDGSQILYLWKLDSNSLEAPERIESAGRDVGEHLAMAQEGRRLGFSRMEDDSDIVRIATGGPPVTLISSSSGEQQGTYSEDGRRIAFSSWRSGTIAVWVAEADGSGPRQLTHGPNRHEASPKWSPDGKHIAFDSQSADGHWHIRVIDAEGGEATQLTFGSENQNIPFWSRDGQWVYFASGNGQGIARVPARGGAPEPIITGGAGLIASESMDGRSIVFQPKEANSPLLERSLAGGPVRQLLPCVQAGAFTVHTKGIYYIPCGAGRDPDPVVHLLGASDHQDRPVFALKAYDAYSGWSLSVSPDGNAMLYSTTVSMRGDLWMIENFR